MNNSNQLEELMLNNEQLSASNKRLADMNDRALKLAKECLDTNLRLYGCCTKIYGYLKDKPRRTKEEEKSLKLLQEVIFNHPKPGDKKKKE